MEDVFVVMHLEKYLSLYRAVVVVYVPPLLLWTAGMRSWRSWLLAGVLLLLLLLCVKKKNFFFGVTMAGRESTE
jgi:hypothetical protein